MQKYKNYLFYIEDIVCELKFLTLVNFYDYACNNKCSEIYLQQTFSTCQEEQENDTGWQYFYKMLMTEQKRFVGIVTYA